MTELTDMVAQAWLNNGRWRDLANQNGFISVDSLTVQQLPFNTLNVPIWINQEDGEIVSLQSLFINDILPDLLNNTIVMSGQSYLLS